MIIIVVVVPRAVAVAAPWIVIGVRIVVIRHGPSSNKNLVISNCLILLFLYILLYTRVRLFGVSFFFMVFGVDLCCSLSVDVAMKKGLLS